MPVSSNLYRHKLSDLPEQTRDRGKLIDAYQGQFITAMRGECFETEREYLLISSLLNERWLSLDEVRRLIELQVASTMPSPVVKQIAKRFLDVTKPTS